MPMESPWGGPGLVRPPAPEGRRAGAGASKEGKYARGEEQPPPARLKTNFTALWEGPTPVPPNNAEMRAVRGPENCFSKRELRKGSPVLFRGVGGAVGPG